jgi:nogalonic acid methyl ester cyclase / aklanonic acid methyl ester cyclase
LILPRS